MNQTKFCVDQIKYLGNIWSKNGLKTDSDKLAATVQMPVTKN